MAASPVFMQVSGYKGLSTTSKEDSMKSTRTGTLTITMDHEEAEQLLKELDELEDFMMDSAMDALWVHLYEFLGEDL
jgi:hypothetical protein